MKATGLNNLFVGGFSGSSRGGMRMISTVQENLRERIPYDPTQSFYTFVLVLEKTSLPALSDFIHITQGDKWKGIGHWGMRPERK